MDGQIYGRLMFLYRAVLLFVDADRCARRQTQQRGEGEHGKTSCQLPTLSAQTTGL